MTDDPEAVLKDDPILAQLIERHTIRSEPSASEFERLCVSIINQQLSTKSATAVRKRVFALFDGPVMPAAILAVEEQSLREAGLSKQKVEYLRNAARGFQENDYTKEGLADCSNEQVREMLTDIKGVGEWTANMYLIFALEREDVLPLGDLAVRRGIKQVYGNDEERGEMSRNEMREIAERWRPHRSLATKYIWAEYESD